MENKRTHKFIPFDDQTQLSGSADGGALGPCGIVLSLESLYLASVFFTAVGAPSSTSVMLPVSGSKR